MNEEQPKSGGWLLPVSIVIAGLMIAGSVYYVGRQSVAQKPSTTSDGNRDAVLGNLEAPVTFIEYGDYQCPFCGRFFHQVEPPLREEYIKTGKVKMVFRNFQILGDESTAAGAASECAKDQGKFWQYHDALYTAETADGKENNGNLNRDLFLMLGQNLGLDMTSFTACLDANKYGDLVIKETNAGKTMGLDGTPTSFINGEKVAGSQPYSVFKTVIDIALQKK